MTSHLHTAARRLIAAQTHEEVCAAAETAASRLTGAADAIVAFPNDSRLAGRGCSSTDAFLPADQRFLVDDIVCQAYDAGESWLVDDLTDVRSVSAQSIASDTDHYRSLLCVPVDDWGVLVAVDRGQSAFSDVDRDQVEQLSSYAAKAFDRITPLADQQEACDLLEEIANILSHDVANPLMVAHGQLDLARKNRDSEHLKTVATAHDRLEELIEDVATLARTGEHIKVSADVDIRTVAERAWATVRTQDANLDVVESTTIVADASRLCQLFENLFRNAVVHGGSTVTVQVGLLDERNGFYIEDNGVGIPGDKQADVFEHGYSSTDDHTGLGLSIVRRIVDAHDWSVAVMTSETGGTRFEITGSSLRHH